MGRLYHLLASSTLSLQDIKKILTYECVSSSVYGDPLFTRSAKTTAKRLQSYQKRYREKNFLKVREDQETIYFGSGNTGRIHKETSKIIHNPVFSAIPPPTAPLYWQKLNF